MLNNIIHILVFINSDLENRKYTKKKYTIRDVGKNNIVLNKYEKLFVVKQF